MIISESVLNSFVRKVLNEVCFTFKNIRVEVCLNKEIKVMGTRLYGATTLAWLILL